MKKNSVRQTQQFGGYGCVNDASWWTCTRIFLFKVMQKTRRVPLLGYYAWPAVNKKCSRRLKLQHETDFYCTADLAA
jgi:hypothetical protein